MRAPRSYYKGIAKNWNNFKIKYMFWKNNITFGTK